MVKFCSAYGCTNRFQKGENIQFHLFPLKNEILMKVWLQKLRRTNYIPNNHSYICSEHFCASDYLDRPGTSVKRLKLNAVPTVFMANYQPVVKRSRPTVLVKVDHKTRNPFADYILPILETCSQSKSETEVPCTDPLASTFCDVGVQTEILPTVLLCSAREERICYLQKKIKVLNQKVRRQGKRISNLQNLVKNMKKKGGAGVEVFESNDEVKSDT